jgi:predicted nucleic acid-binding protein
MIPSLYLDASALVKYYMTERGSAWMVQQLSPSGEYGAAHQQVNVTTLLSHVEVACALWRAQRTGRITPAARDAAERRFLADMQQRFLILDADLDTTLLAVELAGRHPLRAYDAVHLATALVATKALTAQGLSACTLLSADAVVLAAARAEGLATENPNDHAIA